jgi:hypothetical protein
MLESPLSVQRKGKTDTKVENLHSCVALLEVLGEERGEADRVLI